MRAAGILCTLLVTLASPALAQLPSDQPIGRYVVDVRAALPKFPSSGELAADNGVSQADLPGWGLGLDAGAHVYFLHRKSFTLGVGADFTLGRGHSGLRQQTDGTTTGTEVTSRFTAIAPQVSINFGSAAGWSYLSGGLGLSTLMLETPDSDPGQIAPRRKTLNFGGGGRWFLKDRLAFTFDLRFHKMDAVAPGDHIYASPAQRMMVFSAGVSFR